MNKSKLLRGLSAIVCVLLAFAVIMTNTAQAYASMINLYLNIKVTELVPREDGVEVDSTYYKSSYGDLTVENLDRLKADGEAFVELEMEEGAVLLRNENNALPLASGERNVTLFGYTAAVPLYKNSSAGGNNDPEREVSFYNALKEEGFNINDTLFNAYLAPEEGDDDGSGGGGSGGSSSAVTEKPASFYTDEIKNSFASYNDVAIVVVGRSGGESTDVLPVDDEGISGLALHQDEADMLKIINESGQFDKIILIINSAYPIELNHMDEYNIDAALWIGTPGLTGFRGVVDLLIGEVNPSGHLVDTFATSSLSAPATQNFGDYTFANADAVNSGTRDDESGVTKYVVYSEGIYVGYKYYETRYEDAILGQGGANSNVGTFASNGNWSYADEVLYPFGYGLSYTTFEQTLDSVSESNGVITVKVTVKNTGSVAGKDVVEVYAQTPYTDYDRQNLVEKSAIQLAGFGKTSVLDPDKSEQITVTIDKYLLASYDYKNAKGYILDAGDYYIAIGNDAHDALNNILAAKGATGMVDQNGNAVTGNAANAYKWTQASLDTDSYRYSEYGLEVTNQLDDADLNYWIDGAVTYLTRQDWAGTFPQALKNLTATDAMIKQIDGYLYETPADAPSVSSFTQGAKNGLTLVDMHGLEYDDPLWEDFLDQLTLDDMTSQINENWGQPAVDSVNKPENVNQDGPGGVAGPYLPDILGESSTASAFGGGIGSGTAYVGEMVAASGWNIETMARRGDLMAEDCLFSGVSQLWSPGGNIHRTPFSGRNYEYYSEDGVLSYLMSAVEVEAMQAKGLAAAIKHFVFNDMETNRQGVSTFMTEQTAREIYLKAFEGAFAKGRATSTMTAYNRIGCTYVGHSGALQNTILRGEWGFEGATISDAAFGNYMHAIDGLVNGTDFWCLQGGGSRGPEVNEYIRTNDDGNLYKILRESQHGLYYMYANSNLINGLTSNMEIVTHTPWWQTALYAVDVVLAVAAVALVAAYVMTTYGKKKQGQ